jgi:putative DNA primase/helicase
MTDLYGDESIILRIAELQEGKIQFTDTTNAERLYRECGSEIRYNSAWRKWLVFNGRRWVIDDGALIQERGLSMVRGIYNDLQKTSDYRDRIEIERYAILCESVRRRESLIKAASWITALNIESEKVDTNPWLLCVKNGVIDLSTGEFREHRKDDFITKMAEVDYDPAAECPEWRKFVREIMDYNNELIMYLQAISGWAVTGDTSEQTMFILYGTGANGKSTFINTLMALLGDYAIATPTETFMVRKGDQIGNDLARLRGTRLVTTTETELGKKLAEPLIKQITGNDRITARFLYGEFFNFTPTFKVFLATNHKPSIKGTDHGIWRRIKLVPFVNRIPEEKQDKHLEEKLIAEASGILNWLLEGVRRWRKEGLKAPDIVLKATNEYRGEMDVIGNFIKDCCVQKEGILTKVKDIYVAYQQWCVANNERTVSDRYFSLRLQEIGFDRSRTSETRYWKNLGLKADDREQGIGNRE